MARAARTTPAQLRKARLRSRFEGWLLDMSAKQIHQLHGPRKEEFIGSLSGTVVEIGPGTGANMRYYPPDVKVIAVEPNEHMQVRLRQKAELHGVDLEVRTVQGEQIDVDTESADAVVATLVLCGVDDPAAVLSEIRRVLKPGARYFFLEHVAAEPGTWVRRVQDAVMRPHRWAFNGCEVNRETLEAIEAAGFSSIDHETIDPGAQNAYIRPHLVGTAVR